VDDEYYLAEVEYKNKCLTVERISGKVGRLGKH